MNFLFIAAKILWSRPGLLLIGFIIGLGWGWHRFDKAADRARDKAVIAALTKQMQALHSIADAANEREQLATKELESLGAQVTAYAEELGKESHVVDGPSKVVAPHYSLSKRDVDRLCAIYPAACGPR